jgi:YARHG domain
MRLISIVVTALVAAATLGATATVASAQSCQDLWIERNTYYKQAGYCFKTPRAISYFGNGGCFIYNESQVPFPPQVRARINQIVRLERAYGCPR